jgi:uncharacterized protein
MEIIKGERAVFLEDSKTLVVGDLHIGFEIELARSGILVPPQGPEFAHKLISLAKSAGAKRILLLGDTKHAFAFPSYSEEDKVVEFLRILAKSKYAIELVPGNHDGDIGNVLPRKIRLHPASGAVIGKTGLFHGHAYPSEKVLSCDNLIIAHLHPNVALVDSLGAFHKEPCFLAARLLPEQIKSIFPGAKKANAAAQVLIIPAFNPLPGGAIVNEIQFDRGFMKCIDFASATAVLADGTVLGRLADL